ncbi:MAG: aspartate aminotransferase [Rhodospirillaceae bacterium]|nr:aspartate aminotransferase [Rhodospirillaceae bacterium]|tara:strand:- start:730 stop:1935 length:1206 start_codon:yes stop_codon:yes gene_type:complete
MAFIAESLNRIKVSPTLAVTNLASQLKAEGKSIISLGAGEPDFDTPSNIKEAAKKAIDMGQTKYTPVGGTPELKMAISDKFKNENELIYDPSNQITVSNGGKHVIFNALVSTLNKNDEVIIPAPYWVSYPDMVLFAGGKPVILNTTIDTGFKIVPNEIDKLITEKTKWLILNSPSNPTGATYSAEDLRAIGEVIKKYPNIWVMSDDIYEHLVYDGFNYHTFAEVVPELYDRTLTVNGCSKAFAMTGWRIGFAGGGSVLIKAMEKLQSQSTTNPSSVSQAAAIEALNGDKSFLIDRARKFCERRDIVVDLLNKVPGITCLKPEGAFYVYPSCSSLIGKSTKNGEVINNDEDFCKFLLEKEGVAVVQGSAFGLESHFRISYATSNDLLIEACKRIDRFCSSLQ